MNIITSLPRSSDGELDAAFIKEIKTGFELERATEEARVNEAAEEAHYRKDDREIKGLGRLINVIPAREGWRLMHKYGEDEFMSRDMQKFIQKNMPELAVNKF